MIIECVTSGPVDTNGYLVADEAGGEAMIVDAPLESAAELLRAGRSRGMRVCRIVDTHGHWDHVADNAALVAATGAPLLIHEADAARLAHPQSDACACRSPSRPARRRLPARRRDAAAGPVPVPGAAYAGPHAGLMLPVRRG